MSMTVDDDKWQDAKRQALKVLRQCAEAQDTITYKQFVKKIKAIPDLAFHGDGRMDHLLDEVSREEFAEGRGLISVLVVETAFPHMPSDGFFALAKAYYPNGMERRKLFEAAREQVYAAHGFVGT